MAPARFLVLQPAFLGDIVLTLPLLGRLKEADPTAHIALVARQGAEGLLRGHPWIDQLYVWDKTWHSWLALWHALRQKKWTGVLTVHRYFRMGLLGMLVQAKRRVTFDKNPLSRCYHYRAPHRFKEGLHEVDRNLSLLVGLAIAPTCPATPWLFPPKEAWQKVQALPKPYLIVAPTSRWPTKEAPFSLWEAFLDRVPKDFYIYLTGTPEDRPRLEGLARPPRIRNLAGEFSLLELAALIGGAHRVFSVDSATTHIASAMGTPTTTVFCATTPLYGFGPLAPYSDVVQTEQTLPCRPCGLHGHRACPLKHFRCGKSLSAQALLTSLSAAPPPKPHTAA